MSIQSNTVFLSTNHDVLNVLPAVVGNLLTQAGYTVKTSVDMFDKDYPPPSKILKTIDSCEHYVLLATKALIISTPPPPPYFFRVCVPDAGGDVGSLFGGNFKLDFIL